MSEALGLRPGRDLESLMSECCLSQQCRTERRVETDPNWIAHLPGETMQSYDRGDLKVTLSDFVAQIEICRPPHNFFDAAMIDDIATILEQLDKDPAARATVLCSQGKSFCAGADFSRAPAAPPVNRTGPNPVYANAIRIFATKKPIIAAIHGPAVGGGLGLALSADFRVASPEARFAANFVKLGTHAGFGISYTLPRIVGQQRANLLLYTGRRLNGEEAYAWGLADVLTETDGARGAAHALAREIAVNAPLAVIETRETMRGEFADAVRRQTDLEDEKQTRLFATEDHKEGVAAMAARREGNFQGR
jgi:enoyl-CoA hydratase/carnithine racemase